MSNSVGEKIRKFRKRSGISQFELELRIDASPGSISRIEVGHVNPSKETLQKIISVLGLRAFEASTLFNLEFQELPRLVEIAKSLSSDLDLDKILQNCVNGIVYELGLIGGLVFIYEGDTLYLKAMTHNSFTHKILDLLPGGLQPLSTSISWNRENYVVKTVNERTPQYSTVFSNFSKNIISDQLADFIQKMNGTKCTICLPVIANDKVQGALLFSKDVIDKFEHEIYILRVFADYVGTTILNARKYNKLEERIKKYEQYSGR
jgi:transcriptional regulator with XRE-family HTH domain